MPAAGTARIALFRAGRAGKAAAAAAKYRRVGVVRRALHKGRNVVAVKRLRHRKLTRGRYRATITASAGGQKLKAIRIAFRIRR